MTRLARAIARYIGHHIPGDPSVVVQNMPGAGGMVAMDYLFHTAEHDGSVIALVENGPPLAPLFGVKQARYDAAKFNWLGTPSVETAVVLVWHTVPVNSLADLKIARHHHGCVRHQFDAGVLHTAGRMPRSAPR